ncbi:hypothetical protein ASG52_23460 [Methylobacterium sp. Leaf456]|uniref:phage tail protein n=1 Tax=Methylobacterium sp. Leaf456 TaxID=1736382 RepID=UPI0006F28990|nr:tail fiber protein [Methylobacterium sp. Leaf456]KQT57710.1 hypothetical protein ASG52_23460 [Methylobacterium sp. Leaf456]
MPSIVRSTLRTALLTTGLIGLSGPALACNIEPYVGTICVFAFDWCPRGYLPADGRQLASQQYPALFSLLSTTYGGTQPTTFNIPDLRGRVVLGTGTGTGLQPVGMAQQFGQQSVILTSAQTPLVPHTHSAAFTPTTSQQTINVPASAPNGASVSVNTTAVNGSSTATQPVVNGSTVYLANAGYFVGTNNQLRGLYTTTAPVSGNTASIPVTGNPAFSFNASLVSGGIVALANAAAAPTAAVPTQQPSLGQTVCIAAEGLYPQKSQ